MSKIQRPRGATVGEHMQIRLRFVGSAKSTWHISDFVYLKRCEDVDQSCREVFLQIETAN